MLESCAAVELKKVMDDNFVAEITKKVEVIGGGVGYNYVKYSDNTGYLFRSECCRLKEILKVYFYANSKFSISNNRLTTFEMNEANELFLKYFNRKKMARRSRKD